MLNNLMSNPYIWLFLSICTVISIPLAIYTWQSGKQKKEISFSCSSNLVISVGKSNIDQLEVIFSGQRINDLTSTKYYIWNSGNDVLHPEDIVKTRPLCICSNGTAQILDVQILRMSEETNCFSLSKVEKQRVELDFDYVASGEGILVQILHTGKVSDFSFDCKIKGGKAPFDCSDDEFAKSRSVFNMLIKTFNDLLSGITILFVGLCTVIYDSVYKVSKADSKMVLPYVIWGYGILAVVLLLRLVIWHSRHGSRHAIPKILKESKIQMQRE